MSTVAIATTPEVHNKEKNTSCPLGQEHKSASISVSKPPKMNKPTTRNTAPLHLSQMSSATKRSANNLSSVAVIGAMDELLLPMRSLDSTRDISGGIAQGKSGSLGWLGQDPLSWIESLAFVTEKRETLKPGRSNYKTRVAPIRVNGVEMSSKSYPNKEGSALRLATPSCKRYTIPSKDHPETSMASGGNSGNITLTPHPARCFGVPSTPAGGILWDLSFLTRCDPEAKESTKKIQDLAEELESIGKLGSTIETSYKRVRDKLSSTFEWIMKQTQQQNTTGSRLGEQRMLLDILYNDIIHQLELLIEMARKRLAALTYPFITANSPPPVAARPNETTAAVSKKDFPKYMTNWLRNNWINPYPDDDGLAKMARECGTTQTVVSNWLINARTRKWRPAIVKAFDMNRPADLLLEDSLNLFDAKPLRKLPPNLSGNNGAATTMDEADIGDLQPSNKRIKKST